ncbi:MAG: ABC transporter substrate-binding protein, partial [Arenibacterium sp.]
MIAVQPLRTYQNGASGSHTGTKSELECPTGRDCNDGKIRVGLLVPFSGSDAIWGPSCQYSATLAAAQINARGGILGREIELFAADAGGSPEDVARRVRALVDENQLTACVGAHLSSIREA